MITRMMCRIALGLIIGAMAAPELSAIQRRAIQSRVTINSVTCDRGSCRQPLELVNGRSVTIGVTGRGLDALASGVVTDKSGRPIDGVTVELAPPGRTSRTRIAMTTRTVTVTAEGTPALTGLELRFTMNPRGTVTAPLELSIAAAEQTRVTRATAETVRVEAGGATVPLTVEGVNLAAVTSARLLLDGRPVSDLVSKLAARAGSTTDRAGDQLVIELSAGPSVRAGDYQLELMAGRRRIIVPASILVAGAIAASAPSVAAATPSNVRLLAGGNPQIVRLTGTNLDKVTAAHVERSGMELGSVTARLRAPTDPTSRDVVLTAKTGAGPPWDVPLELVLEGGAGGVRVPLELSAESPPRADLTVELIALRDRQNLSLTTPTAGHDIRIYTEIRNSTGVSAPDMALVCRRRSGPGGGALMDEATVRTGPIPGNGTKQMILDMSGPTAPGPGHMSCIVDDGEDVPEEDESNNEVGTTFTAYAGGGNDFSVELRDFEPWTDSSLGHKTVRFKIVNTSPRGVESPLEPGTNREVRWQAACSLPLRPFTRVREVGNMTRYPGGALPAQAQSRSATLWLFPINRTGFPDISAMPATLQMICKVTVGAFLANIPVLHNGDDVPRPDWSAVDVWWTKTVTVNVPNPRSGTYTPPLDVSVTRVSGSASRTADVPPRSDQPTFARFTLGLTRSVEAVRVACSASRPGAATAGRFVDLNHASGNPTGAVHLGRLKDGSWTLRCEANPAGTGEDANPANDDRSVRVEVFTPGADLLINTIEVRDKQRLGLTAPTVGRQMRVYAAIQNRSGQNAADMAFVCRRLSGPNGATLAEASVRTGPVAANAMKRLTLDIAGPTSPGQGTLWCMIDGGNYLAESDESNNEMTTAFTAYADGSNDFSVELRDFQPWFDGSLGHKTVRFTVANTSSRGAASSPPPGVQRRARWQAACSLPARPFANVRETGNMTHYPGGELPAPGQSRSATLWLFPINRTGFPDISAMPATLQMVCKVTVGAFLANVPVLHNGHDLPRPDWGAPNVWWEQSVILNVPNPASGG